MAKFTRILSIDGGGIKEDVQCAQNDKEVKGNGDRQET